jgi:mono/diheme cytochrome c family protein
MAEFSLLGLFHEATPTADTIERLRELGVPDEKITVMSGIPYRSEILGRPRQPRPVMRIALLGAFLGLCLGLFLTVGIFLLYPLTQGGQPLVPIPPTLIVLFEGTMLGTMWAAFFGLLGENRFPAKPRLYDPRITEGHIGVLVELDEGLVDEAEKILVDHGAHHMRREQVIPQIDRRFMTFWGSVLAGVVVLTVVVVLIGFDITKINFPTNMAEQDSIAYLEGPRLAAPAQAVPVQGPVLIAGQPASEPLPATSDSLERGKVLFGITCAVCHGPTGNGVSPVAAFLNPKPADLTSAQVQNLTDNEIYLVISHGFGVMPSMAENLGPLERWDVINYVRTLKK